MALPLDESPSFSGSLIPHLQIRMRISPAQKAARRTEESYLPRAGQHKAVTGGVCQPFGPQLTPLQPLHLHMSLSRVRGTHSTAASGSDVSLVPLFIDLCTQQTSSGPETQG